jgi:peroxiredoxin
MRRYLKEAPVLVGIAVLVLEINAWAGGGSQRRLYPEAHEMRDRQTSALVGRMAPNLLATEWLGAPVDLRAYRGKVIILDFFGAWSNVSKQQIGSLRKLCERYGNQVVMVGVTNLDGQTIDTIQAFVRKNKAPDLVAIDSNSLTHRAYQVQEIPHTFIIDREGVVSFASVAADETRLAAEIDRALSAGNITQ